VVARSTHPTPCSPRANPPAALGQDEWHRLCFLLCEESQGSGRRSSRPRSRLTGVSRRPGAALREDRGDGREGRPSARREEVIPMDKEPGKPQPGKPGPGKPQPGKPEPWKPEPGKPQPGPR
jgi:hypothetical protein